MKVLLCNGYGEDYFTSDVRKILKRKKFPHTRMGDIIEYFENYPTFIVQEGNFKEYQEYKQEMILNNLLLKIKFDWKEEVNYYAYNNVTRNIVTYTIVDMPTDKLWKIVKDEQYPYDESIHALDIDLDIIDIKSGYAEW